MVIVNPRRKSEQVTEGRAKQLQVKDSTAPVVLPVFLRPKSQHMPKLLNGIGINKIKPRLAFIEVFASLRCPGVNESRFPKAPIWDLIRRDKPALSRIMDCYWDRYRMLTGVRSEETKSKISPFFVEQLAR